MSFLPDVRGLPRVYWILWVGTLINRIGGFAATFLALFLRDERGLGVEETGVLMSIHGAGIIAAGLAGGSLADRFGRKPAMLASLTLGPLALVLLSLARDPVWIAVLTFLFGALGEMYRPAVSAAVSDLVPPEDRTRAFGFLYWAVNLGFAVAPPIAGWIAARRFEAVFWVDAASSVAYAGLIALLVPETRPDAAEAKDATQKAEGGVLVPLRDGVFMTFVAINFLVALVFQQAMSTMPMDMRDHGISREGYGSIVALNGVLIVFLQPWISVHVRRYRRSRVLALGAALTGIGFGLYGFAGSTGPGLSAPLLYTIGLVIWTFGELATMPVSPTIVADLSPAHLRGSYQGVFHLSWGVAAFLAPSIGAQVLGRYGGGALWFTGGAVALIAAWAHIVIAPARQRRLAALAAAPEQDGARR